MPIVLYCFIQLKHFIIYGKNETLLESKMPGDLKNYDGIMF